MKVKISDFLGEFPKQSRGRQVSAETLTIRGELVLSAETGQVKTIKPKEGKAKSVIASLRANAKAIGLKVNVRSLGDEIVFRARADN